MPLFEHDLYVTAHKKETHEIYDMQLQTQLKRKDWITNISADKWQWMCCCTERNRSARALAFHIIHSSQTSFEMVHLTYLKINVHGGCMKAVWHSIPAAPAAAALSVSSSIFIVTLYDFMTSLDIFVQLKKKWRCTSTHCSMTCNDFFFFLEKRGAKL